MSDLSAELLKLTISACEVTNDGGLTDGSQSFSVMLNPTAFTHEHAISYNTESGLGSAGHNQKFSVYKPERVSFEIPLDGTGVIAPVKEGESYVQNEILKLKKIVYTYDGDKHKPNNVKVAWGKALLFVGCLDKLSISYTLFKPNGVPLRAKLKVSFLSALSQAEEAKLMNKSSPDLTHLVEFKAGDTLPLLCHRIYNNSAYYLEIARLNGITNFRNIRPGTRLNFPPLR